MNEFDNLMRIFNEVCELKDDKDDIELQQDIMLLYQTIMLHGVSKANQLASNLVNKYDKEINGTITNVLYNIKALKEKSIYTKSNIPTEKENCFNTLESLVKLLIKKYYEKCYEKQFINAQPLNYRENTEALLNIIKNTIK